MPTIVKINSKIGMVNFSKEDLADFGLLKWLRTDSYGLHHRKFIDQQPFEKAASHVFHEKFPSSSVKIADKIILGQDGTVDVFLRITNDFSRGYYNEHPTKLTFSHAKGTKMDDSSKDYTEVFEYSEFDKKKASVESVEMKDLRDVVAELFEEGENLALLEDDSDEPSINDIDQSPEETVNLDIAGLDEKELDDVIGDALNDLLDKKIKITLEK